MGKRLVIVESPAKAKTISRFLGKDYEVTASFGHIRDLPQGRADMPEKYKKEKWAELAVNVDDGYQPIYVVPRDKREHVRKLKEAAKNADELLLATDEDREGESISWHILQELKPKKSVPVRRIVFHEITPEAIRYALDHPRDVDEALVRAQESRRILDRLYGYTLSPVLWRKITPGLSAGRVQSVAVRLIVQRERERRDFVRADYGVIDVDLKAKQGTFRARLRELIGDRVATGQDFDSQGQITKAKVRAIAEQELGDLATGLREAKPYQVVSLERKPGRENPPAPFMTSTLQQEASRKLGLSPRETMSIAQRLYEGIDLGGEQVGLITYMRTDSLTLSERALKDARQMIERTYGKEHLPNEPKRYTSKAKNAQEAHEAIRPTEFSRTPEQVKKFLRDAEFKVYDLIWKRTLACQMKPAEVTRTQVTVEVPYASGHARFGASGKVIDFPGFLKVYVEGSDDPEGDMEQRETILPEMYEGESLELKDLLAEMKVTSPPARYTEASLVKKLEEEGIGRPSTYASILGAIQERGYVYRQGKQLVPTYTAFAKTELLENYFGEYVDIDFTARLEDNLDEISNGKRDWQKFLDEFYRGEDQRGLKPQVETRSADIPFPNLPVGNHPQTEQPIVIRVGRNGPFLQMEKTDGTKVSASIPDDLAPADLTLEEAVKLIDRSVTGPEAIGVDPSSGQCVFHKTGRYGDYLEVAKQADEDPDAKPRRITLPQGVKPDTLSEEDLARLLRFPRELGKDTLGEDVTITVGRYGPYVKAGARTANIPDWREAADMDLVTAIKTLDEKPARGARAAGAAKPPIQEFGEMKGAEGPVRVLDGRFGPYVTDGKTNATLPRGTDPATLSAEQALELILKKKEAGPAPKRRKVTRRKKS